MSDDLNKPEYLDDTDPERNLDYWRQDHGGVITNHNGVADALLKNDKLYNAMKGDWQRTSLSGSKNIITTMASSTSNENKKTPKQWHVAVRPIAKQWKLDTMTPWHPLEMTANSPTNGWTCPML